MPLNPIGLAAGRNSIAQHAKATACLTEPLDPMGGTAGSGGIAVHTTANVRRAVAENAQRGALAIEGCPIRRCERQSDPTPLPGLPPVIVVDEYELGKVARAAAVLPILKDVHVGHPRAGHLDSKGHRAIPGDLVVDVRVQRRTTEHHPARCDGPGLHIKRAVLGRRVVVGQRRLVAQAGGCPVPVIIGRAVQRDRDPWSRRSLVVQPQLSPEHQFTHTGQVESQVPNVHRYPLWKALCGSQELVRVFVKAGVTLSRLVPHKGVIARIQDLIGSSHLWPGTDQHEWEHHNKQHIFPLHDASLLLYPCADLIDSLLHIHRNAATFTDGRA